eukprot:m51a1_g4070 hypothetical protein (180) ;mRNA; f:755326-755998
MPSTSLSGSEGRTSRGSGGCGGFIRAFIASSIIGAAAFLGVNVLEAAYLEALAPQLSEHFRKNAMFRREDDPLMVYALLYPFALAVPVAMFVGVRRASPIAYTFWYAVIVAPGLWLDYFTVKNPWQACALWAATGSFIVFWEAVAAWVVTPRGSSGGSGSHERAPSLSAATSKKVRKNL